MKHLLLLLSLLNPIISEAYPMKDFSFLSNDHQSTIHMSDYSGKVIMLVNTASKCGLVKQYAELEQLWKNYKDKGLMILALPTNDFMSQEPGNDEEIIEFCQVNFGVTFPVLAKVTSKGKNAHPIFQHIRNKLGLFATPKWNFYKYIISPEGELVTWFSSMTSPLSPKIDKVIQQQITTIPQ